MLCCIVIAVPVYALISQDAKTSTLRALDGLSWASVVKILLICWTIVADHVVSERILIDRLQCVLD